MTVTLNDFPVTFYDDDPDGAGSGQFKGVMCPGTCGAPCWQPAPAALAAGETPTLDEVFASTAAVSEGLDETLFAAGNAVEDTLDADEMRALRMVQAAFGGAGFVLNHGWYGDTTVGQHVEDFIGPARGMVQALGYYLEQSLPAKTAASLDVAALASMERVRALTARLEAELAALQRAD